VTSRSYAELLRNRGFASLMAFSIVARLPLGMTGLAVVLLVSRHGAYSRAGLVIALYVTGTGVAGPAIGKLVDRTGRTKVLPPFAAAEAALLCVLAEVSPQDTFLLMACALGAGLCTPPVTSSARALWPVVLPPAQVQVVYALEATLQELAFIAGPSLVAVIVSLSGPPEALFASAAALLAGVFAFSFHPTTRAAAVDMAPTVPVSSSLRVPLPLAIVAAGMTIVGAFNFVELATVAFARSHHSAASAGVVLAVWSAGSLAGGALFGIRASAAATAGRVALLMVALATGTAIPAMAPSIWVLGLLLFLGGAAIAPTFGALYALAAAHSAPGRQTEAFGWLSSGFQAGSALGAVGAGAVVQGAGSRVAYGAAAGVVFCGVAVMARWGRRFPADRSPRPEGSTAVT
jgi:MFS family permease